MIHHRVLVCGGRGFKDGRYLRDTLDRIDQREQITEIIHGGASGADRLAGLWAFRGAIPQRVFEPDWGKHGKAAGPIRNQQMIDEGKPDLVVAFSGGSGTADMVRRAKAAQIPVEEP